MRPPAPRSGFSRGTSVVTARWHTIDSMRRCVRLRSPWPNSNMVPTTLLAKWLIRLAEVNVPSGRGSCARGPRFACCRNAWPFLRASPVLRDGAVDVRREAMCASRCALRSVGGGVRMVVKLVFVSFSWCFSFFFVKKKEAPGGSWFVGALRRSALLMRANNKKDGAARHHRFWLAFSACGYGKRNSRRSLFSRERGVFLCQLGGEVAAAFIKLFGREPRILSSDAAPQTAAHASWP